MRGNSTEREAPALPASGRVGDPAAAKPGPPEQAVRPHPLSSDDMLRLWRALNRAICSVAGEAGVLQAVCDALVTWRGCVRARIGLIEDADPCVVRFAASAGRSPVAHAERAFRIDGDVMSDALPLVRALETGEPVVSSCAVNTFFRLWFTPEDGRGVCAAFPLRRGGHRFGVLALFALDRAVFSEETLGFLREIAGLLAHGIGALREQKARLQAERALRTTECLLQATLCSSATLLTVKDMGGRVVRVLNGGQALPPGFSQQNMLGLFPTLVGGHAQTGALDAHERQLIASGRQTQAELAVVGSDGLTRSVWTTKGPLFEPDGRAAGLYEVIRDITDFRRVQAQARMHAARYQSLFHTASDALLTLDDNFRILTCNEAAERLFGVACEALCAAPPEEWFVRQPPAEGASETSLREFLVRAISGATVASVMRYRRADGQTFDAEVRTSRFEDQGRFRILLALRDITQQKEATERLLQITRARTVLSDVNQAMVRADSEESLLNGACRALVGVGGYPRSWGLRVEDGEAKAITVLAFGRGAAEVDKRPGPDHTAAFFPTDHPLASAIRRGEVRVCRCESPEKHAQCQAGSGMREQTQVCAAIPLWDGATLFGAFVVSAASAAAFSEEEIEFLKELSRDISFGITALRTRLARQSAEQKRYETSELLRNVIEGSQDFIYVVDFWGRYLQFFNRGGLKRYGIDPDRVIGRTTTQVWGSAFGRHAMERYHQILVHGTVVQGEETVDATDGGVRQLWVTNGPLRGEDGKLHGVFGVMRDVTEFRRAERVLRANSERLEVLQALVDRDFDSEEDLIRAGLAAIIRITASVVGCFAIVENDRVRVTMQIRKGGETVDAPFLPVGTALPLAETPWAACAESRKAQVVNNAAFTFGDGSVRLTMTRHVCVPVVVNDRVEVLASVANKADDYEEIDVQQVRLFMENLWQLVLRRRADQQSRLLLAANEQSMSAVLILDAAGTVTYVNQAFERMRGLRREELLGRSLGSVELRAGIDDETYARVIGALGRGESWVGEMKRTRPDGTVCVCEGGFYPVRNAAGLITHYASVQRDITAELALRNRLEQSQKLELVGHLTGGIAHDFNNLLQVINGYAEFMLNRMSPRDVFHSEVSEIFDAGRRAAHMTGRLLAFSRRQVARQEPLCLNRVIQDMEKMLRRLIGETVDLRFELDAGLPDCLADNNQLEQVLLNLCVNARDAMPEGGTLTLRTHVETVDATQAAAVKMQPGPTVVLTVTDSGTGMTPSVMEHLFEPFFTTKERGKGTGLGLATVYGIVMQHNGHIRFTSEVGHGTTCTIWLSALAEPPLVDAEHTAHICAELGGDGELLVVGEDEDHVRKMLVRTLTTHGYRVLEAADGNQVLALVRERGAEVAMIVCDVCMPGRGGLEMQEALRASGVTAPPVLFVTGYTDLAENLRAAGKVVDILPKPVSAEQLLQRVKAALNSRTRGAGADAEGAAPRACDSVSP